MATPLRSLLATRGEIVCGWVSCILHEFSSEEASRVDGLGSFRDGSLLLELAQKITKRTLDQPLVAARDRPAQVSNVHRIKMFLKAVPLATNFDEADIVDGKADEIIGVLWLLARYWFATEVLDSRMYAEDAIEAALLDMAREKTGEYLPEPITDLTTSWQDGTALCALVCAYDWRLLDFTTVMHMSPRERIRVACEKATDGLGVRDILAGNTAAIEDAMCMSLYLSYFLMKAEKHRNSAGHAMEELARDSEHLRTQLAQLSASADEKEALFASLQSRALECQDRATEAEKVVRSKDLEINRLRAEVSKLTSKLASLTADRDREKEVAEANMHRLRVENKSLREENRTLSLQLNRANTDGGAASYQLKGLVKRVAGDSARPSREPPSGTVFLVFTDVEHSTALWGADMDMMETALFIHNELIRNLITKYNGYEVKTEGDAFMIAFSSAEEAVAMTLETQRQLLDANWPEAMEQYEKTKTHRGSDGSVLFRGLRIRMGIHGGIPAMSPDPTSGRMDYFGPVVNLAARVSSAGCGGQILVSDSVITSMKEKVEGMVMKEIGLKRFKGVAFDVPVYQILPESLAARNFDSQGPIGLKSDAPMPTKELEAQVTLLREKIKAMEATNAPGQSRLESVVRRVMKHHLKNSPTAPQLEDLTSEDDVVSALEGFVYDHENVLSELKEAEAKNTHIHKDLEELQAYVNAKNQKKPAAPPPSSSDVASSYLKDRSNADVDRLKEENKSLRSTVRELKEEVAILRKKSPLSQRPHRKSSPSLCTPAQQEWRTSEGEMSRDLSKSVKDISSAAYATSFGTVPSASASLPPTAKPSPSMTQKRLSKKRHASSPDEKRKLLPALSSPNLLDGVDKKASVNAKMQQRQRKGSLRSLSGPISPNAHSGFLSDDSAMVRRSPSNPGSLHRGARGPSPGPSRPMRRSVDSAHSLAKQENASSRGLQTIVPEIISSSFLSLATLTKPKDETVNRIAQTSHPHHQKLASSSNVVARLRFLPVFNNVQDAAGPEFVNKFLRDEYAWLLTNAEILHMVELTREGGGGGTVVSSEDAFDDVVDVQAMSLPVSPYNSSGEEDKPHPLERDRTKHGSADLPPLSTKRSRRRDSSTSSPAGRRSGATSPTP